MREILFRGKREDNSEWVEGVPFFEDKRGYMIHDLFICDEYLCTGADNTEILPATVGQYTGLTDKNGKKIFEGDIVKGKHNWHNWNHSFGQGSFENDEEVFFAQKIRGAYGKYKCEENIMFKKDRYFYYRNYAVEYYANNGGYRVRNGGQFHALTQTYIYNRDLEVIGNIHDNPELLKGGEG